MATGYTEFDSVRLVYRTAHVYPELRVELFRSASHVEAFLSLIPLKLHAESQGVKVALSDSQGTLEELLMPLRGAMRVKLSLAMTEKFIAALLREESPELCVEGVRQHHVETQGFLRAWNHEARWWHHAIKNPFSS